MEYDINGPNLRFSSNLIRSPLIIRTVYVLIHQTPSIPKPQIYKNLTNNNPHQLTINNSNVLFTRFHEPKRTALAAMFM